MTLNKIFEDEKIQKKICHVMLDETKVENSDYVFQLVLGSCVSVILCGIDQEQKVWLGANHMYKSRVNNLDVALKHVSDLHSRLNEKNISKVYCLGVFGAGYRKNSAAKDVAKKNLLTIIEALKLFDMTIELFETGYKQGLTILKSDTRDSFLIKHYNINNEETKIIEIPLSKIFQ